jgi:two-component system sensor histidine kinase/response regulator
MENRRKRLMRAAARPAGRLRRPAALASDNRHQIYRSIFNNATIGIARTDAAGRFAQVNQTWLSMLQYERREVLGREPSQFTHSEDRSVSEEQLAALIDGRIDRFRLEKRYLRKDGSACWVDLIVSALRDSGGRLQATIALCADINERKEAERALRGQQQLMSNLLSSTKEGFWFIDGETRTVDVNPAMCALLGRTREEVIGRTIFEFVDDENAAIFRAQMAARRTGKTGGYEITLQRPDGSIVSCLNNATPLFDEDGKRVGSVGLWADITGIKETQHQLELAKDEAQAANHAKSAFLATMSHEIRTPLNGVISVIELLADTPATPEQRVQIGLARKAADQLLNIVGNVLDLSKLEAGKIKIEAVPFELDALVESAAETFATEASRKGLKLIVDCDPVDYQLVGDPTRIKQIVLNLVGNAVKFTHAGGIWVRAVVKRSGPAARLALMVRDSGIGIPATILPQLMQKFVQASDSTTRNYGGSGLGLAICKQLAEAMGGALKVQSEHGQGSTFSLELSLPVSERLGTTRPGGVRSGVVLITDDGDLQTVVARLAQADGHGYFAAPAVDAALQILRKHSGAPRTIIIDEACASDGLREEIAKLSGVAQPADRMFVLACPTADPRMAAEGGSSVAEVILKPLTRAKLKLITASTPALAGTAPPQSAGSEEEAPGKNRHTVLVAEDNPTNQYVVRKTLERLGCDVHLAADGIEAVRMAAHQRYDLVLMDLQMPRLDGIGATRRIRAEPGPNRDTPIIAITANAFTDDVQRCLDAGMNGHLSKPLRRQTLAAVIEKLPHNDGVKSAPEPAPG